MNGCSIDAPYRRRDRGAWAALLLLAAFTASLSACKGPAKVARSFPIVKNVMPDAPFPEGWRVVDLTQPLSSSTPRPAHPRQFPFERMDLPAPKLGGLHTGALTAMEHTGTHLASPRTRVQDGNSVDTWGEADLLLPLVLIAVRSGTDTVPAQAILDDVRENGPIPAHAAVLLRTPRGAHRPVTLSEEAARLLVREMRVRLIACDGLAVDPDSEPESPAANAIAAAGAFELLGLRALDELPSRGAFLVTGAVPVVGAAGAPTRALALLPPNAKRAPR